MAKRKETSAAVAASIEKTVAAGGGRVTMTLNRENAEIWRKVLAEFPAGRGQQLTAFMAACRAFLAGEGVKSLSNEELLAEVRRRMK